MAIARRDDPWNVMRMVQGGAADKLTKNKAVREGGR